MIVLGVWSLLPNGALRGDQLIICCLGTALGMVLAVMEDTVDDDELSPAHCAEQVDDICNL